MYQEHSEIKGEAQDYKIMFFDMHTKKKKRKKISLFQIVLLGECMNARIF